MQTAKKKPTLDGLRKAERITTPTTKFVFSDCNGFFSLERIDDVIDLSAGDDMPFFVYDCDRQVWGGLAPASDLIEAALEGDWFDGAEDHAVHVDELQASLNQWNAKQNIEQFVWTDKRIIVLDEKRFEEWLNSTDEFDIFYQNCFVISNFPPLLRETKRLKFTST